MILISLLKKKKWVLMFVYIGLGKVLKNYSVIVWINSCVLCFIYLVCVIIIVFCCDGICVVICVCYRIY